MLEQRAPAHRVMAVAGVFHVESPLGLLAVSIRSSKVTGLRFVERMTGKERLSVASETEELLSAQLNSYFKNPQWKFAVQLDIDCATPFRSRVWSQLRKTSAGDVLTYRQLADRIKNHPRAVGGACRANPAPIIIPCHRVIPSAANRWPGHYCGSDGARAGRVKAWLLRHEAGSIAA